MCLWCNDCLKRKLWVLRQKGAGNKPTVRKKHLLIAPWASLENLVKLNEAFGRFQFQNQSEPQISKQILLWRYEEVDHKNHNIPTGVMNNFPGLFVAGVTCLAQIQFQFCVTLCIYV